VLAALFWFPWILSTAVLLLQFFPVRGVVQVAVAWWFAGNLLNVWLTLAGLAATFYLLPKLVGRPLQTHYLAMFVFWTVLLFGTWTGIPLNSPLPAWMSTMSSVATVMMIVPILCVVTMLLQTVRGTPTPCGGGPLCYAKFGVWALVLATIAAAIAACPAVARVTDYTWFPHGHTTLRLYGFFAMTMFAAVYHILPRISGLPVSPGRIKLHFWLAMPGAVLFAVPMMFGGIKQGLKLATAEVPFMETVKAAQMAFRLGTLGEMLIAFGALVFLVTLLQTIGSFYRGVVQAAYADAIAVPAGEVKS
jgi:cytochrome c oxidase cbb3-type subunit I